MWKNSLGSPGKPPFWGGFWGSRRGLPGRPGAPPGAPGPGPGIFPPEFSRSLACPGEPPGGGPGGGSRTGSQEGVPEGPIITVPTGDALRSAIAQCIGHPPKHSVACREGPRSCHAFGWGDCTGGCIPQCLFARWRAHAEWSCRGATAASRTLVAGTAISAGHGAEYHDLPASPRQGPQAYHLRGSHRERGRPAHVGSNRRQTWFPDPSPRESQRLRGNSGPAARNHPLSS